MCLPGLMFMCQGNRRSPFLTYSLLPVPPKDGKPAPYPRLNQLQLAMTNGLY